MNIIRIISETFFSVETKYYSTRNRYQGAFLESRITVFNEILSKYFVKKYEKNLNEVKGRGMIETTDNLAVVCKKLKVTLTVLEN
jgi:hypothetical protein